MVTSKGLFPAFQALSQLKDVSRGLNQATISRMSETYRYESVGRPSFRLWSLPGTVFSSHAISLLQKQNGTCTDRRGDETAPQDAKLVCSTVAHTHTIIITHRHTLTYSHVVQYPYCHTGYNTFLLSSYTSYHFLPSIPPPPPPPSTTRFSPPPPPHRCCICLQQFEAGQQLRYVGCHEDGDTSC